MAEISSDKNSIVKELRGLGMTREDMIVINACLTQAPDCVLDSPFVRWNLVQARVNRKPRDEFKTFENRERPVIENAVEHNLAGLLEGSALSRPDLLVRVLQSIGYVYENPKTLKVLSVGPRSEAEILSLVSVGFAPENIRGLDLISYSPFIDLGDMHAMPYGDASFDVVILGWVLAYSKDNPRVVKEVLRVAKPGSLIAIGCEYNPASSEEISKTSLLATDYPRFNSTEDILKLFDGHIESVIFRHDIRPAFRHKVGALMTIFELKTR